MTEDEVLHILKTKPAQTVLDMFATLPEAERRQFARPVAALVKTWSKVAADWSSKDKAKAIIAHAGVPDIALLATGTPSELKSHRFHFFHVPSIVAVMRALAPSWIDRWVADQIEASPFHVAPLRPLWEHGLCQRPESDAVILGYYAHRSAIDAFAADPEFRERDVWRMFDVEGGGEFSLASHDKYSGAAQQWSTLLLRLSQEGKLDRQRLLDASLAALERDYAQFRAGWYSRFHVALAPDLDETDARRPRYLGLLSSSIPPTVSFALKQVRALDKAGRLPPGEVLAAVGPALLAQQKTTVTAALAMATRAAQSDPSLRREAARLVAQALIAESADLQSKVLDAIDKLGAGADPEIRAIVTDFVDLVAPSVRGRLTEMIGAAADVPAPEDAIVGAPGPCPVSPLADLDATLLAYLEVLEDPRDAMAVERALDGLARHGATAAQDPTRLQPLRKRCVQILQSVPDGKIRRALAVLGQLWSEGGSRREGLDVSDLEGRLAGATFADVFLSRGLDIVVRVRAGQALPMLSAPSDDRAMVAARDLCERLVAYRTARVTPGETDLNLALLRLAPDGRLEASARFDPQSEMDHAVAYALGAETPPQGGLALRVAAWAARQPTAIDPEIVAALPRALPDCGVTARHDLKTWCEERSGFRWFRLSCESVPECHTAEPGLIPALFYPPRQAQYFEAQPCGAVFADIAWAATVRPGWSEPFFRQALLQLDTDQKLADHPCRAYLEPLMRPEPLVGPLARATLAYYLAATDKSVTALSADVIVELVSRDRLSGADFGAALRCFVHADALPLRRWIKALGDIAVVSARHSAFVREVIVAQIDLLPEIEPRDFGGLLELLYELHVGSGTPLAAPGAKSRLQGVTGRGKSGRFAKKLVALG